MKLEFLSTVKLINARLDKIESNILRLEEKLNESLAIQKNHLIRIKNGEELSDEMILLGRPYNDLSPQKAFEIFSNENIDFLLLDVSDRMNNIETRVDGSLCIPLEELASRYSEIISQTIPILVISEKGIRSIMACELLIKKGYYNVNNISGGHKFWPGHDTAKAGDTSGKKNQSNVA